MRYFYKDKEIHSKEEWKLAFCESYSGKEDDKHWKPGRSGERLAEDFMGENPCGENTMVEMVKKLIGAEKVSLDIARIEHASVFDSHPRPRIQDLAIWGHADGKKIFIGVEAKVDESFGSVSLSQQKAKVEKMKNEGVSTKAGLRLDELIRDFLGNDIENHGNLRYQLLYYLAGSFREQNADIIFMPVIVYISNLYDVKKGNTNHKAYQAFMDKMLDKVGDDIYYKRLTINGITKDVYSCYIVK